MATLGDLAALNNWAYTGDKGTIGSIGNGQWVVAAQENDDVTGLHIYALKNEDGDVVFAVRGTEDNFPTAVADAILVRNSYALFQLEIPLVEEAEAFVKKWIPSFTTDPITFTGHSLGGYVAQLAMLMVAPPSINPNWSFVGFNSPGVPSQDVPKNPTTYKSYNFNTQGDVVHLAGGQQLGQVTTLAVGPTYSQVMSDFGSALKQVGTSSLIAGTTTGVSAAGHDVFYTAHTIGNFIGTNQYNGNAPGYFSVNTDQAAETAAQWFSLNPIVPGSPYAQIGANGGLTISDAGGDALAFSEPVRKSASCCPAQHNPDC